MLDPKNINQPGRMSPPVFTGSTPYFQADRDPDLKRAILGQGWYHPDSLFSQQSTPWNVQGIERRARSYSGKSLEYGPLNQFITNSLIFIQMPTSEDLEALPLTNPGTVTANTQKMFNSGWGALTEPDGSEVTSNFLPPFESMNVVGKSGTTSINIATTSTDFLHWYPAVAYNGVNLFVEVQPVRGAADSDPSGMPACYWPSNSYEKTYKRIETGQADPWIDGLATSIFEALLNYAMLRGQYMLLSYLFTKTFPKTSWPKMPIVCIKFGSEMSLTDQKYGIATTQYQAGSTDYSKIVTNGGVLHPAMALKAKGYKRSYERLAKRMRDVFISRLSALSVVPDGFEPLKQLKFAWCPQNISAQLKLTTDGAGNVTGAEADGTQILNKFVIEQLFPPFNLGPLDQAGGIEFVGFDAYSQYGRALNPRYREEEGVAIDKRWQWYNANSPKPANVDKVESVFVDKKHQDLFQKPIEEIESAFLVSGSTLKATDFVSDAVCKSWDNSSTGAWRSDLHSEVGTSSSSWRLPEHCMGLPLYALVRYFGNRKRYLIGETNCYVVPKVMHDDQQVAKVFGKIRPVVTDVKEREYTNRDVLQALFSVAAVDGKVADPQISVASGAPRFVSSSSVADYYKYVGNWMSKSFWLRRASEYLRLWAERRDISISLTWFVKDDDAELEKTKWLISAGDLTSVPVDKVTSYEKFTVKLVAAYNKSQLNKVVLFNKPGATGGRSYGFTAAGTSIWDPDGQSLPSAAPAATDNMQLALMEAIVAGDKRCEAVLVVANSLSPPVTGFIPSVDKNFPAKPIKGYAWASAADVDTTAAHFLVNVPPPKGTALSGSQFVVPPTCIKNSWVDP